MDNDIADKNFIQNHSVLIDHQKTSSHIMKDYNSRTEKNRTSVLRFIII